MASFSVDVSDIVFAGGRTGSKVVTISNAPSGGIGISNTGYGTHFKVIVQEQNVSYQIKTKSTNTSGSSYSSRIRFYNNGDSTDYVDIPIVQYSVTDITLYADNLMSTGTSGIYSLDLGYEMGSTDLYIDVRGDYTGFAKVTSGSGWLSVAQASTAVTDTGFYHYIISYTDNTDSSSRTGQIQCTASGSGWINTIEVNQAGGAPVGGLSVSPTSTTVSDQSGSVKVTVTGAGAVDISYDISDSWITFDHKSGDDYYFNYTVNSGAERTGVVTFSATGFNSSTFTLQQNAGSSSSSISVSPSSLSFGPDASYADISLTYGGSYFNTDAQEVYTWVTVNMSDTKTGKAAGTVSVASNTTTESRRGNVYFSDELGASIALPIEQAGISFALSANPSTLNIPARGGSVTTAVTYEGTLSAASLPSWLSETHTDNDANHRTYTVTAASNGPTQERTFNWRLDDDYNHCWVYISQEARKDASLVISPTSKSVGEAAGTVEITVRSTNISDIIYNISGDWIKYKSKSGSVYTFSYYQNDTMSVRQGSITFSGGGISKTFTLTQEESGISASPSSLTFSAAAGQSKTVVVTYKDSLHIVDDTPDWIRVGYDISGSPRNYYFTTELDNTSIYSKQWDVIFYNDKSRLRVPIIQKGIDSVYLTVSPSSSSVSSESGTMYVSVAARGIKESDINVNVNASWVTRAGNSNFNFYFDYTANTGPSERIAKITFSALGKTATYTLTQRSSQGETMKVTPTELNYTAAGGTKSVTVSGGNGTINVNNGSFPSWLSIKSAGGGVYNLTTTKNTGKARSFTVWFTDNTSTVTMNVYQQAGDTPGPGPGPGGNVVVSPDSLVFRPDGGSSSVTVTYTGTLSINTDMFPGWLSMVSSGDTYTFSVSENIGTESRSFGVIFRSGGDTAVLNILQGGRYASFSVTPEKIEFGPDASSRTVYFGFVPSAGLGYQVKSGTGGWLSVSMNTPVATVSVTNNYGTAGLHLRRSSSIKFYNLNDPDDYVVVLIEQEGAGAVYSMWNDYSFTPDDVTAGDDFHFLISINGGQINDDFYGVSPYIEGTGRDMRHSGIVPLNISRYLNKCIEGNRYILFDDSYYKPYVWNQLWGEVYVDIKHLDKNGDIIKLYPQIMFWNDWSYKVKCYDYNRTLNDPINKKGCSGMYVPFCVYTDILDESTSYSVTKTDEIGEQVTNVLGNPHPFAGVDFAISCDRYYNAQKVEFKRGSEVVLSYDMTHCGDGYLLYRNRFGGWDSFLIEGNIKKKDSFTRSYMSRNGSYDACLYNVETVDTNVKTSYELSTSWLSDDESERLVYHLLSSPTIYFHSFKDDSTIKVNIVDSSSEYKKFKNGRNLVSYVITVEDTLTRQVNK